MQLTHTSIPGVHLVDVKGAADERGFFGRTWDAETAKAHGLQERFDYTCISANTAAFTLRGMHCQRLPHGETKLVRCTKGRIFDVIIDLRPDSPTFRQWTSAELTAENRRALYVPEGCAHGFLSLEPESEVLYHIAGAYVPDAAAGVRWNDPAFGIVWPAEPVLISPRDAAYPDFAA